MSQTSVDIAVVTDPRFSGGTASSVISDVASFLRLGLSVGLVLIRSRFFDSSADQANPQVLALRDLPGVKVMGGEVHANLAFLHHPMAFFRGVEDTIAIRAPSSVLVAHHPPFRGDGSLEYNPLTVERQVLRSLGCRPRWSPVSGTIRAQLRCFAPFLALTCEDWVNTFDAGSWRAELPAFTDGRAVVGRHGRADALKWPERFEEAVGPLSPGAGWKTRIMGLPPGLEQQIAAAGVDWDLVPFNAEPVPDFLRSLDAFCYFYHRLWVEAFGRTIGEAILMERPCVLDPRLEANFGELAYYCRPAEATACLEHLRTHPQATQNACRVARSRAVERFGDASIARRLRALFADPGTRSRLGPKSATAPQTLRKVVGLALREQAEATSV
ncbi:glycosyltransferase [Alloyangia pacifica]|uniref:Glycosyltransferase family 1 protein n=1 Tax=Alloyangia pacifica TaxID=311180 RepID=A0A1I6WEA1_9RHOB|nr:glycosyltransferase [Alloyangia pacifica]SDI62263.1 hypothetical protein SAMN04488245_12020 [Alloyangia pacifica]SFT24315.1 hypothetical protein SAMN04488050_11921 [Alloyangia pacifica]